MVICSPEKPHIENSAGSPGDPPDVTPGRRTVASSTVRKPRDSISSALIWSMVAGVSRIDSPSRLAVVVS